MTTPTKDAKALQTFGAAIRSLRESMDLTQTELGNMLGCHQNSVRNVEQSGRCSASMAQAIRRHLKLTHPTAFA